MKIKKLKNNLFCLEHLVFEPDFYKDYPIQAVLLEESSKSSLCHGTGSSFLWVGEHHLLNRAEVYKLIEHMQRWLVTGSLREGSKLIE